MIQFEHYHVYKLEGARRLFVGSCSARDEAEAIRRVAVQPGPHEAILAEEDDVLNYA